MNILGLLVAAVDAVSAHRLRTLLGVVSIVVGIASVTLVGALGDVGRAAAEEILERQSGRPATFAVSLTVPSWAPLDASAMADHLVDTVALRGGEAARVLRSSGFVEQGTNRMPVDLVATDPGLADVFRFRVVAGRWLRPEDRFVLGPVVTLNLAAAADVGLNEDASFPVPTVLVLGERVAGVVVGIVDDGIPRSTAYLPVAAMERWSSTAVQPALFFWVSSERSGRTLEALSGVASRLEVQLDVQRIDDPRAADRFIGAIQLVLGGVAALSLLTGGIGITNLALALVDQRAKEFAIRRAFGASRRDIFVIVLLESVITVGLGGLLGVLIALGGATAVGRIVGPILGLEAAPGPPLRAAGLGLVITLLVGFLVGFLPAQRATSGSVIRAIRD